MLFPRGIWIVSSRGFLFFQSFIYCRMQEISYTRPSASACLIKVELTSNNGVSANCTEGGRVVGSI